MPPLNVPVSILAGKFIGVRSRFRVRCPVRVALECDRRHGDGRCRGEPLFERVVFGLAVRQPEPPAVIVDHDRDMIGIVEGGGRAFERGVIEIPFRRCGPPDEPGKVAPVFFIARTATVGRKIELVPPLQLRTRRQRQPFRPPGCRSGIR